MPKCTNCGTELEEGAKFCLECGTPVPQTKKCIKCGFELPLSAKFCPECGTKQDGTANASASGFSMGDKNVIAGDVIGHKEETHIAGNATIIKNEDQTKQVKRCHICGSLVQIVDGFDCPECGQFTCSSCYNETEGCCTECTGKHNEQKINRYKEELRIVLADGRIDISERDELNSLRQKLGISAEKAKQLEEELKSSKTSELTTVEKINIEKAENLFFKEEQIEQAFEIISPVYQAHKNDEKILSLYLLILAETDSKKVLETINNLQVDILIAFIVNIGIRIRQKELVEAEKLLNQAVRIWHDNALVKCFQVIFNIAMFREYKNSSFLESAKQLSENLGEAQNELELSYQVKVQTMVQEENNENIPELTKEFCEQNKLYFHIINTVWFNEIDVNAEDLANKISALKSGTYILHVSGNLDNKLDKVKRALMDNKTAKFELDLKKTEISKIRDEAFGDCDSLTSIKLPDSVTVIDEWAFISCTSLSSIEIPDSVTVIGEQAFFRCLSLTSITIPASVTEIGEAAFSRCSSLINISVSNNNSNYKSQDGVLFDKNMNQLIQCPNGKDNFYIPKSVRKIGNGAFSGCTSLTSIQISDSVTEIGSGAFAECESLTSIEIPESVTKIGKSAFYGCTSLTSVEIPNTVTEIGDSTFERCESLTSIEIPESVTKISTNAFCECTSLINISVSNDNSKYKSHDGVLYDKIMKQLILFPCGKKGSYTIPKNVKKIDECAFYECASLTSITIPNSVTEIGDDAFSYCSSLTSIEIPDSVTEIGGNEFSYCSSLTSIKIPDSVTKISEQAFEECSSLTSIEIPDSVKEIGWRAFSGCTNLTSITIPANCEIKGNTFGKNTKVIQR